MNNKRRRVISALLACALIVSLTACSGDTNSSSEASNSSASQTESAASSEASTETVEIPADAEDHVRPDDGKEVGYQLEKPADGEEIAVLHTSMGDIRIRLFPDADVYKRQVGPLLVVGIQGQYTARQGIHLSLLHI